MSSPPIPWHNLTCHSRVISAINSTTVFLELVPLSLSPAHSRNTPLSPLHICCVTHHCVLTETVVSLRKVVWVRCAQCLRAASRTCVCSEDLMCCRVFHFTQLHRDFSRAEGNKCHTYLLVTLQYSVGLGIYRNSKSCKMGLIPQQQVQK